MIRAYAYQNVLGLGMNVALSLVRHPEVGGYPAEPQILRITRDGDGRQRNEWEVFDPQAEGPEPTLVLRMEEAFALQDALAELRHGTSELRALRKDYDAERGRVDRLIETLGTVATAGAR